MGSVVGDGIADIPTNFCNTSHLASPHHGRSALEIRMEPVLMSNAQLDPRGLADPAHLFDFVHLERHRLLAQDAFDGILCYAFDDSKMMLGPGTNTDDRRLRFFNHLPIVAKRLDLRVPTPECRHRARSHVADRDDCRKP